MQVLQDAIISAGKELQEEHEWIIAENNMSNRKISPTDTFVRVLMKHLVPLLTLDQLVKLNELRKVELTNKVLELQKELEDLE